MRDCIDKIVDKNKNRFVSRPLCASVDRCHSLIKTGVNQVKQYLLANTQIASNLGIPFCTVDG